MSELFKQTTANIQEKSNLIWSAAGKTVCQALYSGDKLVEMQSVLYNGEEITFTPAKAHTRAKIMIWESLDGMIPVCGSAAVR